MLLVSIRVMWIHEGIQNRIVEGSTNERIKCNRNILKNLAYQDLFLKYIFSLPNFASRIFDQTKQSNFGYLAPFQGVEVSYFLFVLVRPLWIESGYRLIQMRHWFKTSMTAQHKGSCQISKFSNSSKINRPPLI